VAFRGQLTAPVYDKDTGDNVQWAGFTALKESGRYYLDVPGVGRSWNFSIAPDVYARTLYLVTRAYYGQRCGIAVDLGPEFPGYKHEACHLKGEYHASSGKSGVAPSSGGWHDAGDYGRYTPNSGQTTGALLWTYELFRPRVARLNLHIPESGNGTPDLLNEIRWNLRWMLTMQDRDGGVWQKQTSERFCAFVMPERDTSVSYVIGTGADPFKSSCATGDFAAVMAIAGRVYQPFDAKFARQCLDAARQAFTWLEQNPAVLFRNPAGVSTGEYGDRHCEDEALWAAAELWRSTHDDRYQKYFVNHYQQLLPAIGPSNPPSWQNVGAMALWAYVLGGAKDPAAEAIRKSTVEAAGNIAARALESPYRNSMQTSNYVWGSNSIAANYALQLVVANAIAPNPAYVDAALENLHYLLGRNTFSLSWITQDGENPFRHPHHRPSAADQNEEPWPGLLSGGPNHSRQDPAMNKLPDLPPAKMYLDEQDSYASNEVAINWNAPLVLVLASVMERR
jgi:endoglucanase